jgi:hypothetical protein
VIASLVSKHELWLGAKDPVYNALLGKKEIIHRGFWKVYGNLKELGRKQTTEDVCYVEVNRISSIYG